MKFVDALPPRENTRPANTGTGKRQGQVEKLKTQPWHWAHVESAASVASASNIGNRLRQLGCEVAVRGRDVYARWPGDV